MNDERDQILEVLRRLTPDNVGPDPREYRARCEICPWKSIRMILASSAHEAGADHVRLQGHSVVIERFPS